MLVLNGEFDIAARRSLSAGLLKAWIARSGSLTVDLSGVTFLDSAGAEPLFTAARACAAAGGTLTVTECSQTARRSLLLLNRLLHTPLLLESDGALPIRDSILVVPSPAARSECGFPTT